ncbi:MAG: hypothetical protein WD229_07610, partial [Pirellulales bacterium]
MHRRNFLAIGSATLAGAVTNSAVVHAAESSAATPKRSFKLKYGPHFGMFQHSAGESLTDQLRFAADQGFTAWEDNGMKGRPVETQEEVGRTMEQLGITMGVFVATGSFDKVTFAGDDQSA